jgi:hypothetical protein
MNAIPPTLNYGRITTLLSEKIPCQAHEPFKVPNLELFNRWAQVKDTDDITIHRFHVLLSSTNTYFHDRLIKCFNFDNEETIRSHIDDLYFSLNPLYRIRCLAASNIARYVDRVILESCQDKLRLVIADPNNELPIPSLKGMVQSNLDSRDFFERAFSCPYVDTPKLRPSWIDSILYFSSVIHGEDHPGVKFIRYLENKFEMDEVDNFYRCAIECHAMDSEFPGLTMFQSLDELIHRKSEGKVDENDPLIKRMDHQTKMFKYLIQLPNPEEVGLDVGYIVDFVQPNASNFKELLQVLKELASLFNLEPLEVPFDKRYSSYASQLVSGPLVETNWLEEIRREIPYFDNAIKSLDPEVFIKTLQRYDVKEKICNVGILYKMLQPHLRTPNWERIFTLFPSKFTEENLKILIPSIIRIDFFVDYIEGKPLVHEENEFAIYRFRDLSFNVWVWIVNNFEIFFKYKNGSTITPHQKMFFDILFQDSAKIDEFIDNPEVPSELKNLIFDTSHLNHFINVPALQRQYTSDDVVAIPKIPAENFLDNDFNRLLNSRLNKGPISVHDYYFFQVLANAVAINNVSELAHQPFGCSNGFREGICRIFYQLPLMRRLKFNIPDEQIVHESVYEAIQALYQRSLDVKFPAHSSETIITFKKTLAKHIGLRHDASATCHDYVIDDLLNFLNRENLLKELKRLWESASHEPRAVRALEQYFKDNQVFDGCMIENDQFKGLSEKGALFLIDNSPLVKKNDTSTNK